MLLFVLFQMGAIVRMANLQPALASQISLIAPLELVAGVVWMALGAWVLMNLLRRKPGSAQQTAWIIIGFSIYSLIRLFLFSQAEYDRGRLLFLGIIILLALTIPAAGLVRSARLKIHSTEIIHNDRKIQD